tara:strand:- start:614 stop:1432 length:819 start_codon:yes stop_codon:yes gene_type:complete
MAKPSTRQGLIDYCLRRLGAPVLEINVDDDQIDDLVDDALQYFQERHFDGVQRVYLKHQVSASEIDQARNTGITTTATSTVGVSTTYDWTEAANFIQVPDSVIGVEKVFKFGKSTVSSGMFNIQYQLFLNDIYWFASTELLSYSMTKSRLEDIDHLLTPSNQIRFNKRQNRLYLDIDWASYNEDDYIILDCFRILDPNDFTAVYNDSFLKEYLTALIKRQWGQNLIKFQGVKLPGGIELNGRQLFDDSIRELEDIKQKMSSYYELPPLDFIG